MPERRFTHCPFKQKGLVSNGHRVTVQQVYLHLRSAGLVVEGLQRDVESLAVVIQILE